MGGSQSGYNAFTFSGREDLGGGMNAFFALNHRFSINDGHQQPTATPAATRNQFYRNAWVGLGGGFGDVRLGRMLMPLQDMNGGFDPFDTGYVGSDAHRRHQRDDPRATTRSTTVRRTWVASAFTLPSRLASSSCCGCSIDGGTARSSLPLTQRERPVGLRAWLRCRPAPRRRRV